MSLVFELQRVHDYYLTVQICWTRKVLKMIFRGSKKFKNEGRIEELYFCYFRSCVEFKCESFKYFLVNNFIMQKHPHYLFSTKSPRMHCLKKICLIKMIKTSGVAMGLKKLLLYCACVYLIIVVVISISLFATLISCHYIYHSNYSVDHSCTSFSEVHF